MNSAMTIAQLVLQYGVPAANQIATMITAAGGAENVTPKQWQELRDRLWALPDYWDLVNQVAEGKGK